MGEIEILKAKVNGLKEMVSLLDKKIAELEDFKEGTINGIEQLQNLNRSLQIQFNALEVKYLVLKGNMEVKRC